MKVRATLKLRNEIVIKARENLGMSQAEVAKAAKVRFQTISALECLRFNRVSKDAILKLAVFYAIDPDELAPPELRNKAITNEASVTREIPITQLLATPVQPLMIDDVSAPLEREEMAALIDRSLDTLTFREREIIKLRFGLGDQFEYTMDEVAKIFRITRERVRQIEMKALRKMQHPIRSKRLRQLVNFEETGNASAPMD